MTGLPLACGGIVAGLVLLILGGELLVRGASKLAAAMRISPLVIGLTVVAFGTSSPELAVSLQSAFAGNADIALGNVIGSNILNVLFILGVSAIVAPLVVSSQLIRLDVPLMIGASVLLLILGSDGRLTRIDGLIMVSILAIYIGWSIRQSRRESLLTQEEFAHGTPHPSFGVIDTLKQLTLVVGGLVLLGLGANWLVGGAVTIATRFGVSQLIIGLTIVAVGTSLPEVVTSMVASYRGERDIAVGNVVGSNLFNILCVLGFTSLAASSGISVPQSALRVDIPIMIAVAVACLPIFFTGHVIARWEGAVFLFYYLAYTTQLILAAVGSSLTRNFAGVMLTFVIPLTCITLLIAVYRYARSLHVDAS